MLIKRSFWTFNERRGWSPCSIYQKRVHAMATSIGTEARNSITCIRMSSKVFGIEGLSKALHSLRAVTQALRCGGGESYVDRLDLGVTGRSASTSLNIYRRLSWGTLHSNPGARRREGPKNKQKCNASLRLARQNVGRPAAAVDCLKPSVLCQKPGLGATLKRRSVASQNGELGS